MITPKGLLGSTNSSNFQNVALGSNSLGLNTIGSSNTAIGYFSLSFNTTGNQNTAIGSSSLSRNTTGIENTASGSSSLLANTTGEKIRPLVQIHCITTEQVITILRMVHIPYIIIYLVFITQQLGHIHYGIT